MHGRRSPALGPRFEDLSQGDQGDDHPRGLEKDSPADEEDGQRVEVGGQRPERDEGVHVGTAGSRLFQGARVILRSRPEHDRRDQDTLEDRVPHLVRAEQVEGHGRRREDQRYEKATSLLAFLLGVHGYDVARLVIIVVDTQPIADLVDGGGEGFGVDTAVGAHRGGGSGEVHRSVLNSLLTAQDPFPAHRTDGAGHPIDVEGKCAGVIRRRRSPAPRSSA